MNQLLIVAVAAAATFYALKALEVPALRTRAAELEAERDGLLRAALKAQRPATVARIAGERRAHQGYTEAGLLRMAGPRDCE